ncbi:Zn-ribbon domain-containing OB-fold protein [Sphingomonas immobilis]|uniref:OB-fold domain-containing protein n=1 Tax=Sphingomonas immobilis TaxID=3063997 RepID=A0ABT8ZXP1_9SPHN|nr:OB-fold domain-containing protein [Sphingomonas sp. CA1-15]MDO7842319.1 OB-fold domain-containing protein [Sphingomonas sp. CA1-15]
MNAPIRILPELTPENTPFWTGGERGELMIAHCDACDHAIHPPELICPVCLSRSVTPRAAAGTGVIHSYTVNYQPWLPNLQVPYALAVVDLDGEPGVRLTAQMQGIDPESVAIGQKVRVAFVQVEDVWIPEFHRIDG